MKHGIRYALIVSFNLRYVFAVENWISSRTSRNLDTPIETNLTTLPEDNSIKNATEKRSNEFWLLRDDNGTEEVSPVASDTAVTEIPQTESFKPMPLDDPEWTKEYEMNELLFMSRKNCNFELQVNEWEEKKLKIQYETMKIETTGQCRLNLRGKVGTFLAVLISNVQLIGRGFRASPVEVLKVVIRSNHFDYTLKEYYGNEEYYPVMLTESDQVALLLVFNGTSPTGARSGYNLQVFNYYKNENNINGTSQQSDQYGYGNSIQNVDHIFITTASP